MRLASLLPEFWQNALNFPSDPLQIEILTPKHHVTATGIKNSENLNVIQTPDRLTDTAEAQINDVMVRRLCPPPLDALVDMFKVVSHCAVT